MCCNSNRWSSCGCGCASASSCGCGCASQGSCGCGCGSNGSNNGITTLPSFPDWPVWPGTSVDPDFSVDTVSGFPVYVSVPGRLSSGSANLSAAVNVSAGRCPCARG